MNPTVRRVLLYAAFYGAVGVGLGVMLALWTEDAQQQRSILLKLHRKAPTVDEPTPEKEGKE